jgi:hypothetical protein
MNTKIIDGTATLSNGFQCGQWVRFIDSDGEKWELVREIATGECTWNGDTKVRDLEVRLEGRGIVGGFRGISAHSREPFVDGFFGFTAEELSSPAPEKGYTVEPCGAHAHRWVQVETLEEYLIAKFVWKRFSPWSMARDGIHEMPYVWGCQPAASYSLVIGGELIDSVTGCGDSTPQLTESEDKCVADRKIYSTCEMLDRAREVQEANKRMYAAADAGDSEKWSKVRDHLRASYEVGCNPLRNLRVQYPGIWTYYERWSPDGEEIEAGDVIFTQDRLMDEGWAVIYKPAK